VSTTSSDTTTAIEREIAIAARPETVWEFFVDPEKACRWMGTSAELDPQPGGIYRVEVIPGNVARGVVFILIGGLVVDAGWTYDPQKSRGLDGALKTLAGTTAGPYLLMIVAIGLLAYVLYSLMESRYRITHS